MQRHFAMKKFSRKKFVAMNANFSTKFSLKKKTVEKFDKGGGVSSVTKISESSFRLVKR